MDSNSIIRAWKTQALYRCLKKSEESVEKRYQRCVDKCYERYHFSPLDYEINCYFECKRKPTKQKCLPDK